MLIRIAKLVLGLPTIVRPAAQYVKASLKSLLRPLHNTGYNSTVILLFLGDEEEHVVELHLLNLFRHFRRYIELGLVEIIVPDRRFFATLATAPCDVLGGASVPRSTESLCGFPYLKYIKYRYKLNYRSTVSSIDPRVWNIGTLLGKSNIPLMTFRYNNLYNRINKINKIIQNSK